MNVSAVIVTRGDVDLSPVLDSLPREWEKVIWDNSTRDQDIAVAGRYIAIDECEYEVIYVQDDDCILEPKSLQALARAYVPGRVTCNMPRRFRETGFYDDHALVGFGAIFHERLARVAFDRFTAWLSANQDAAGTRWWPNGDAFHRTCDVVFTTLTPRALVDVPYADREFASAPNRMWKQPDHVGERTRMRALARKVRDA